MPAASESAAAISAALRSLRPRRVDVADRVATPPPQSSLVVFAPDERWVDQRGPALGTRTEGGGGGDHPCAKADRCVGR